MDGAQVIVIAPNSALRHSVAFMLRSGGFEVACFPSLADAFASPTSLAAACAVVDDEAVEDWQLAQRHFSRFAKPLVLLVDFARTTASLPFAWYLEKPFLGEPLIEAVQLAAAHRL